MDNEYLDDGQEYYETVLRKEEYNQDVRKDTIMFLDIISRRVTDKRRRVALILNYFGEDYDRENFGDC
jgi:Zn-finger domain-containing protein